MTNNHFFLKNIRDLSPEERLQAIAEVFENNPEFLRSLGGDGALPINVADGMIENVIGRFELPLGVATNFKVNGKDYLITSKATILALGGASWCRLGSDGKWSIILQKYLTSSNTSIIPFQTIASKTLLTIAPYIIFISLTAYLLKLFTTYY